MAESLGLDGEVHDLKLGTSFHKSSPIAFHSIRYDFKPASVDKSQKATVDIGESNSVTVTVPHIEGSGVTNTVYKGNKRPSQKECILVINHQTGEITLEKLTSNIHVKKTRQESMQSAQRGHITNEKSKDVRSSPAKKKNALPPESSEPMPQITEGSHQDIDLMSSSNSSDSEDEDTQRGVSAVPSSTVAPNKDYHSVLSMDLQLSESGSDSD